MAKIAKKTKRYPSDLTDEEWVVIAPLMPKLEQIPITLHRSRRRRSSWRTLEGDRNLL